MRCTNTLSTLPRSTLIKAVEEKDNPYYCKQALSILDNKGNGKLVDLPRNIMNDIEIIDNFLPESEFKFVSDSILNNEWFPSIPNT